MRNDKRMVSVFLVRGYNRERLLNLLHRRGITVTDVKEKDERTLEFSFPTAQEENFFAITADLCYTVKKKGEKGILAPFRRLWRRTGVLIGALLFIAAVCVADGAVFSVDYYGNGAIYSERAQAVLDDLGIRPFVYVDEDELDRAQREIVEREKVFSFASVEKRGTRLKINLILSPEAEGIVDTSRKELRSPAAGRVESVTVLRGTALVSEGDLVKEGDVLVAGYNEIKETVYETYVLASVNLIAEETYEYRGKAGEESAALAFAEAQTAYEIVREEVFARQDGDETVYTVSLQLRIKVK